MSIGTPVWSALQILGRPLFTLVPEGAATWIRSPSVVNIQGSGFGQGGFGQGGFGGAAQQSGVGQPIWTAWTID